MRSQRTRRGTVTFVASAALLALAACRNSAPSDVFSEDENTEAIVFVKTTGEETLNRSWAAGNLYVLSPISPDGTLRALTDYEGASISDPCVSFDGDRVLFSMRPPGQSARNIYEIGIDGSGLRQVTHGGGHDFDPLYLPDGSILFTSSRAGEMDEYNHSPAEHMYVCAADGSSMERISFNQSDDFDPVLLPNGRVMYTRWEHFGMFNRFPLFATNPDGTGIFHHYGPHGRNFFHAQPMPDGRIIAIESTMVNEDAGPIAVLKTEAGPADPAPNTQTHWNVLNANVNNDGAPWAYGAFKYPFPLGGNLYVASYTLPAATEEDVDYGLYTFRLVEVETGDSNAPVRLEIQDLTFLYNDPLTNDYDAQLIAPHDKPPVVPRNVDDQVDWGIFTAQDVFNRGTQDGQERPQKNATGVDAIDRIAVLASRPTLSGEANDFSANEFEKRAFLGYAPVQPDGSFSIRVPADTPISFATLDQLGRGFVVKRTWLAVRPGEHFSACTGCHEDRSAGEPVASNPNPMALAGPPTDLNIPSNQFRVINYVNDIEPIIARSCRGCHFAVTDADTVVVPAPGDLDLRDDLVMTGEMMREFPRSYANLSGESVDMDHEVVDPAFPRRSILIDWLLGAGSRDGMPRHPDPASPEALSDQELETLNLWVLLGAQYR